MLLELQSDCVSIPFGRFRLLCSILDGAKTVYERSIHSTSCSISHSSLPSQHLILEDMLTPLLQCHIYLSPIFAVWFRHTLKRNSTKICSYNRARPDFFAKRSPHLRSNLRKKGTDTWVAASLFDSMLTSISSEPESTLVMMYCISSRQTIRSHPHGSCPPAMLNWAVLVFVIVAFVARKESRLSLFESRIWEPYRSRQVLSSACAWGFTFCTVIS